MTQLRFLLFSMACVFLSESLISQSFVTMPYLEGADPNHIHVSWITNSNSESIVEWGLTQSLGSSTSGGAVTTPFGDVIHEVELTGLTPATTYYYRAVTGGTISQIYSFSTPPETSSEQSFNLVAMSDMQGNPQVFGEINEGILDVIGEEYGDVLSENLGMVLIPGDLVVNGWNYGSWFTEFFSPSADLFSRVPVYPVLGNHEANTDYYFDFFHLPENGTAGFEEHWWYHDYSNVRVIGLDSNSPYDGATQLAWLQTTLNATCVDPDIDFVFVQLHHPHLSELWLPGESDFTTDVVGYLEQFSSDCGKPSIHFFGHTHGYSRGQSKEHDHLMVNVASAGGAIDYWGEWPQADYPEFTVSQDEWGFVLIEVEAGDDPQFLLKRYSQGIQYAPLDNEIKDSIRIKLNNIPPSQPTGLSPANEIVDPNCVLLIGDFFSDADGDRHMASEWQISTSSSDFSSPVYEAFRTHENWYFNEDTQEGDIMIDEHVTGLPESSVLYWRVRYRDHSLGWSDWSTPAEFTTSTSSLSSNLISNPGAEAGTSDWTVTAGVLESLTAGECAGTSPNSGTYYFGVGALCLDNAFGEAYQDVDLSGYGTEIDSGEATAYFGAYMSDYSGDDVPEIQLEFLDGSLEVIGMSDAIQGPQPSWVLFDEQTAIPPGAETVRFYMRGYRNAGFDNDSYVDDVYFQVGTVSCDASDFDEDADGIIDSIDNCLGLYNPDQADFDNDNVGDECEDSDGDGLLDSDEINTYGTDPGSADSDEDGLDDYEEVITWMTNPWDQDSDDDGLTDILEINQSGTDPNLADTDGDGCTDDLEFSLECPDSQCESCPGDLNNDLTVNVSDLLIFLGMFGSDCQ